MIVHFTPELEAKLTHSAAQLGRDPEELAQEILSRHFDEESRFIEAVRHGEAAIDMGDFITDEQVGHRLQRFLKG